MTRAALMPAADLSPPVIRLGDYWADCRPLAAAGFDPARRRTVVTIHGMVESPAVWQPTVETLAGHFRDGWELSLPWHGDQGFLWGQEATVDRWLEPLVDALPRGPKVVLAHSFGANALLALLQRRPWPDLEALVMLSPYYKTDADSFDWNFFLGYVHAFDAFIEASIRIRPGGDRLKPQSMADIIEQVKRKYSSQSWVEFYNVFSRTPRLNLGLVAVPTLVMGGDRDLSIPAADLEALHARLPRSSLSILPGCGHFGMIERGEAVSGLIDDFLNSIKEN